MPPSKIALHDLASGNPKVYNIYFHFILEGGKRCFASNGTNSSQQCFTQDFFWLNRRLKNRYIFLM